MSYYKKFRTIFGSRLWAAYIRWAYETGIKDFSKLNFSPDFNRPDFKCLLCGVGNENTANEFIKFVARRNRKAGIIIIDIGEEQISAVKKLVEERHPQLDIQVRRVNALKLDELIEKNSLDWIETDGFLEYFDGVSMEKLLNLWSSLLKPNGFITFRDFSTSTGMGKIGDTFRIWLGKHWLGVQIFRHTKEEFNKVFKLLNFKVVEGLTPLPSYKRFSVIKQ
jgi:SAM-dependent methyltransferase